MSSQDSELKIIYHYLENVECLEKYQPGGYHPLSIGALLHSRYRVVHKLGHGGHSTIWLAQDIQQNLQYVAVKILTAQHEQPSEVQILNLLDDKRSDIPRVLDEFNVEGPNGVHHCIVMPPARASLSTVFERGYGDPFQLPVARALVAQVIQAVEFIHSRGVVHADLHIGNIMLRFPQTLSHLSTAELYKRYSPPYSEPVKRVDQQPLGPNVPTQGISPIWMGKCAPDVPLAEALVLINDFGESFTPANTERRYSSTPPFYCSPESYFEPDKPLSFPSDIWALGSTIFTILGDNPVFGTLFPTAHVTAAQWVDALGFPPGSWGEMAAENVKQAGMDRDGTWTDRSRPHLDLRARFDRWVNKWRQESGQDLVSDEEAKDFLVMLSSMLIYNPEERASAKEVAQSDWMRRWGIPELEKLGI